MVHVRGHSLCAAYYRKVRQEREGGEVHREQMYLCRRERRDEDGALRGWTRRGGVCHPGRAPVGRRGRPLAVHGHGEAGQRR